MPIHQTKRQSAVLLKADEPRSQRERDLEKRLQILRRQVYGKNSKNSEILRKPENQIPSDNQTIGKSDILTFRSSDTPSSSESFRTDLAYLNQDLLKILIFSSLAIGAQIGLFFLSKNQVINLKFF